MTRSQPPTMFSAVSRQSLVTIVILAHVLPHVAHAQLPTTASHGINHESSDVAKDAATRFGEDATSTPPPISFRPWAEGVPEEKQKLARSLFEEGNTLLRESLFAQAIQKYQDALSHWDHPAIHYNHALALSTLDQPIKTREELIAATRYGAGPLGPDEFQQAQRYKTLVEKQLALLTVECSTPQATVSLNGKTLFTAPGRFEGFVVPGEQLLSAAKHGHVSDERAVTLIPGKPTEVRLALFTDEQLTQYERLWPEYPPWIVAGTGLLITGVGAWFYLDGLAAGDEYEDLSDACASSEVIEFENPSSPTGTSLPSYDDCRVGTTMGNELRELNDRAERHNTLGVTMLAAGGAVLATGAVLLYINRAQPRRLEPRDVIGQENAVQWSASVSPNAAFVVGRGNF